MAVSIQEVQVKSVLTKSNLPVADFSVNPCAGCAHACHRCYASFMKRFSSHPEPWAPLRTRSAGHRSSGRSSMPARNFS
ncbi:MAG: hypothetical protein K6E40_12305 [Desulfovibrio sp.]|nr:hypothetical protein [Desulfovibrio sp.]